MKPVPVPLCTTVPLQNEAPTPSGRLAPAAGSVKLFAVLRTTTYVSPYPSPASVHVRPDDCDTVGACRLFAVALTVTPAEKYR